MMNKGFICTGRDFEDDMIYDQWKKFTMVFILHSQEHGELVLLLSMFILHFSPALILILMPKLKFYSFFLKQGTQPL